MVWGLNTFTGRISLVCNHVIAAKLRAVTGS